MNFIVILLILLIAGFFFFIVYQTIKNSFWWRLKQVERSVVKKDNKKNNILLKYNKNLSEEEKKDFLKELSKKGKVQIPYSAFDYIYRHIDEFGIIDKDGKIVLINKDAYDNIIKLSKEKESGLCLKNNKQSKNKTYFDVQIGKDGTIVKKDFIEKTITIKTKDKTYISKGTKMITFENKDLSNENEKISQKKDISRVSQENNDTLPKIKKEENSNTKTINTKQKTVKIEADEVEVAKKDNNTVKTKKSSKQKIKTGINDLIKKDLLKEQIEKNITPSTDINTDHEKDKNTNKKKEKIDSVLSELDDLFDIVSSSNSNPQKKNSKTINPVPIKKVSTESIEECYFKENLEFNTLDAFCSYFSLELILEFFDELFLCSKKSKYSVIVKNQKNIYIDSAWFFKMLGKKIKKDDREIFYDVCFIKNKNYLIDTDKIIQLLSSINLITTQKYLENIFILWNDKKNNKKLCIMKKSYLLNNKNCTNLFLLLKKDVISKLRIDTKNIKEVEFNENNGGFFITSKI